MFAVFLYSFGGDEEKRQIINYIVTIFNAL